MFLIPLLLIGLAWSAELRVEDILSKALENNRELRAMQRELEAGRLEVRSAKGGYYPRLKFEETFTRTDIPAYAFMSRLNQERITLQDFDPARLNNPKAINNFETKIGLEIPIWMGGRVQIGERIAKTNLSVLQSEYARKKEDIALKVYEAYLDAVLAKMAIKVAKQSLKEAEEHQKLAERMHEAGMALLSDVFRAKVYAEQAKEKLYASERDYQTAKRALEVIAGVPLGEFEVEEVKECPVFDTKDLYQTALQKREDLKGMQKRAKVLEELYRLERAQNLPNIYAGVFYFLNSKDFPLGADGRGYMLSLGLSWTFETGLSSLRKAEAHLERKRALEERIKGMEDQIGFEVERARAEYEKAMNTLTSARERVRASQEVLRVMELRYKNGLARMVDVLDAQTQLDMARFEEVRAIVHCHKAFVNLNYSMGTILEVKR
ncbi:TolC family protein [Thermocrinis sp.]